MTDTRVYGGDPNLIHVPDGTRDRLGQATALWLERAMRMGAENRTLEERATQRLCAGCYMVVGFDMMIHLADDNGQSRTELARCMINAFTKLLADPDSGTSEEITVLLDPC